ncbi:hypothetical protein MettiDRAFT_0979 [Methanolobus tindarius DSM 2278]|uniref:Uncharacterized protein n=2 Tax=Methanolobus tindarius TaxID=2221 RepID=W9DV79_METTI|nr:hypothetical protein MettiDRAFT_0979 [Methanolobus tindarius DSM 2278]
MDSGQSKFGHQIETGSKTRLEIDAREGLGIDKNDIGDTINQYMNLAYKVDESPANNLIEEVEIFFADGVH